MRVVVIHGDSGGNPFEFESATDAGVGGQTIDQRLRIDAELDADGQRGDGVQQHVITRHRQREFELPTIGQHHHAVRTCRSRRGPAR